MSMYLVSLTAGMILAAGAPSETGTARFTTVDDPDKIPQRYRLAPHTFEYRLTPKSELPASGVRVLQLTYPSPVESAQPLNNTVYAEYYRPVGEGPFPAVLVLDIL